MSVNRYNPETGKLERIAGGTVYADAPIGAIQAYGGAEAPRGWLLCDGSAVSRTVYSELFAKIGTAFGEGDGSTTFNIPDLREATLKGTGENPNGEAHVKSGGLALGEFVDDRIQNHKHMTKMYTVNGTSPTRMPDFTSNINDSSTSGYYTLNAAGARLGDTTEVKAVGVNFIIKAENIIVPHDFAEYIRLATTPDWSRAVGITAAQLQAGYTCPGRGIITGIYYNDAIVSFTNMTINGVLVTRAWHENANPGIYSIGTVQCLVAHGDVVKIDSPQTTVPADVVVISFVPYKVQ